MQALVEVLRVIPIFNEFTSHNLEGIAKIFIQNSFKKGQILFEAGKERVKLYILVDGSIGVYNNDICIQTISRKAAVGFSALFADQYIAKCQLIADSDLIIYECDRKVFEDKVLSDGDLSRKFLRYLGNEVEQWKHNPSDVMKLKKATRQLVVFDSKEYDRLYFGKLREEYMSLGIEIIFVDSKLTYETVSLAYNAKYVCVFVNDSLNKSVISRLKQFGVELIALRCAGFNNVDLETCKELQLSVARVPAYSPYAVAEHAVALVLSLNRKIPQAFNKTRAHNFALSAGMAGFDLHDKTVGVIGTGKIGSIFANIMMGFGCKVLCHDIYKNKELESRGAEYVSLDELYSRSKIISLHSPLLESTKHMINQQSIAKMIDGVMLINTSRGGLVDSEALIEGLKSGKIGYAGLDVYEYEAKYFFSDQSEIILKDDYLSSLLGFNNVIITSHQAFLTQEALTSIAQTTLENIKEFIGGKRYLQLTNSVNLQ